MRATELGRAVGSAVLKRVGRVASRVQEQSGLPVDVLESDGEYLVVFDAPGATASEVDVRYQDDAVLVQVDRFREHRDGFEMRFPGRALALDGRAALPEDARADPTAARATLRENGTLYVFVPKERDARAESDTGEDEDGADESEEDADGEAADAEEHAEE